jgi:hypothetical protein
MFQEDQEIKEKQLSQDVRRTIILSRCLNEWGMPDKRILSKKDDDVIEFYSFPPSPKTSVWRIVSIGMSGVKETIYKNWFELLFILDDETNKTTFEEIANFLMDLFAHSLKVNVTFEPEKTIPETPLMPTSILPKAVLLDEPRGEVEELERFIVGNQQVDLIWVIPIYGTEQQLIVKEGIEAFDKLQEKAAFSLSNIKRPALI